MARVLVVDDDSDVSSFLAEALVAAGHEVRTAADGAAALDLLAQAPADVVVTDLRMPGMSGLELLRLARARPAPPEVLVLTAHGSVPSAVEAMRLGACDYLEKPLRSPDELRARVAWASARHAGTTAPEATPVTEANPATTLTWGAPAMAGALDALQRVAATDATVLLLGESGTGKEVAARAIHRWSRRAPGPFVAVNCAALSEQLLESEIFGHEKGAFTGAAALRRGRLELAEGGTFFLDEVGEMKPDLQARWLRVLQERTFERVGGQRQLRADVRWIAATNRDLATELRAGRFREDLYHRLAVFPVRLPPLRERREDIPHLADALVARIGLALGRPDLALSPDARAALAAGDWPGNVRELANVLERAAILTPAATLDRRALGLLPAGEPPPTALPRLSAPTMDEAEAHAIRQALRRFDGNRRRAAEHLGIGLRTLYDKLRKHDIR